MEVVKNIENKLLNRKEIIAKIDDNETSLKRYDVKVQLAKKLKVKEDLIIVQNISQHFGSRAVKVTAYVYDNADALKKLTPEHIAKRNVAPEKPAEETVEEAAPAPAAEETPATEEAKE